MRTATRLCHAIYSTLKRTNRDEVIQALNDLLSLSTVICDVRDVSRDAANEE
jgi:hypothetical protein